MLTRLIATVAALLLACASPQAQAHVRAERVSVSLADLVAIERSAENAPPAKTNTESKTAPPARATLENAAPGKNAALSHCRAGENWSPLQECASMPGVYQWDGTRLAGRTNATGSTLGDYQYAYGWAISSREGLIRSTLHTDVQGTPQLITDGTGAITGWTRTDVWGVEKATTGQQSRLGHTGYLKDPLLTDELYAQARQYRAGVGRFTSRDPWEGDFNNPVSLNPYLYGYGNPGSFTDPDGLAAIYDDVDDIPGGTKYHAVTREGKTEYYNENPREYADDTNYRIAFDRFAGTKQQIKPLSAWERVQNLFGGNDTPEPKIIAENEEAPVVDAEPSEIADYNRDFRRHERSAADFGKSTARFGQQAFCAANLVCSGQEAYSGLDQEGKKLSTVDRALAAAPVGLLGLGLVLKEVKVAGAIDSVVDVPDTQKIVKGLTDRAVAELRDNPSLAKSLMSPGSYRQLAEKLAFADASYGKAVERLVARYINESEYLSSILFHTGITRGPGGKFIESPDFIGKEAYNLRLIDITTEKDLKKHLNRTRGPGTDHVIHPGLPKDAEFD
jgi:RHS repeat-associated protein